MMQIILNINIPYSSQKRKKIGVIPIQSTAKARRLYKMRGRNKAVTGRPRAMQRLSVQMTVGDDDDQDAGIVRHKLPGKQTKKGPGHSLNNAIVNNKRCSK